MSTFRIPNSTGQIRQDNRGDTRGELWETFNMDLATIIDKLKISKKFVKVLDEIVDLDDGKIQAFEVYDRNFWIAAGEKVFKCSTDDDITDSANWSEETDIDGDNIGTESDMAVFGGLLLISTDTDIISWNGTNDDTSWWQSTVSGSALTTLYPHIMHLHRGGQETLFVTDANNIHYHNATASPSTITLQNDLVACCISSGVSATWVGTYSDSVSDAYVYEVYVGEQLDSVSVARNAYKIDGRAVLAMHVIDNVPYIVTERGNIQRFNGAGFTTVASFPFAFSRDTLDNVAIGFIQKSNTARPIHPKGIGRHNDSLYININSKTDSSTVNTSATRTPSGIWEFNYKTGSLTHKSALTTTSTNYGADVMDKSGPLIIVNTEDTFLIAGGTPGGGTNGMFADSDSVNQGFFITPEITSQTIKEVYEAAYIKAKTLASGESIKLKYRTTKRDKVYATATFAETDKLNFTLDTTIEVGDEVTFSYGNYAGHVAHITKIDNTATVSSITLDTSVGVIGEAVNIIIENWILHKESYTSADKEYKKLGIGESSPWIQYKIIGLGDLEIRQFISKGNAKNEV